MSRIFGENTKDIASIDGLSSLTRVVNGGDSIDLRKEFHQILHGGPQLKPKGHYVTLKHFLLDKPTKEFDPVFKEARGDDPFESISQHILCYRARPYMSSYNEEVIPIGLINQDTYVYYFEYNALIGMHDFIYEYGLIDGQSLNLNNLPIPKERYNIKFIDPRRADFGRIEYIRVIAEIDGGNRT